MYRNYRTRQKPVFLDLQEMGLHLRIYGEIDNSAMRHMNPSLAWHDGDLYISIRSCNFMVQRKGKWSLRDGSAYSRTDVLLGKVKTDSLEVSDLRRLDLSSNSPIRTKVAGLEDVRLFSRKNGLFAIGFESDRLTKSLHNQSAAMAVYKVSGNSLKYIETLDKPNKETVEKNWCPADTPSTEFDFTYSDTQVYKKGKLIGQPSKSNIHGGSQLIKQKDGTYLSLVHEKILDFGARAIYDKYEYVTYLARHGSNGIITELTPPFRFGTLENIEFASGMVESGDDLIMSLGIRDCKHALARISKEKLVKLLKPIDES